MSSKESPGYGLLVEVGLQNLSALSRAVRLYEETLSIRNRVLGPEHPRTLTSRSNLALGYSDLGRYEEAVRLNEETLSIRERVLGPEHPDTLGSRNNLAGGYSDLGRYEEAVRLNEETLSIREQLLDQFMPYQPGVKPPVSSFNLIELSL